MRIVPITTLLMTVAAWHCLAQDSQHSERLHLAGDCRDVALVASTYLQKHGVLTVPFENPRRLWIGQDGRQPWTDAQGNKVNDFKVYWNFANRNDGEKLPFGMWHMRLAHYQPTGEIALDSVEGGCDADFRLFFQTSGGLVIGILPVDSQWEYGSNGRMERGYLDGISVELDRRKPAPPKYSAGK